MLKRVFISRELEDCGNLPLIFLNNNIELVAESLISFESIPFNDQKGYDVIFFSSFRSADFFLSQTTITNEIQIACVGSETARKLTQIGFRPAFIGENSGDPQQVAQDFKNWLGNRIVLFPHSDQSLHSIANLLQDSKIIKLMVYKTLPISFSITPCDLYIFSSPSNVKSFFSINKIEEKSKVIAWGKSTAKELIQNKIPVMNILQTGTLEELEAFIISYFNLK